MHKRSDPNLSRLQTTTSAAASRLDWDDLRYVLAVARAGTLSGAARELSVKHSTMMRRIDAAEEKLGVRLFERLRSGYVPTEAGETLRRVAEQCEPMVAEAERRIVGGDARLTGSVQVTTGFVVAQYLLPKALAAFCAAHPDIEVEIQGSRERMDLSRREADVAVRMSAQVPDYLLGRELGEVNFRVYCWHESRFNHGAHAGSILAVDTLARTLPWICFQRDAQDRVYDRWMHANIPQSSVVARADHFPTSLALLRTGMGVALLPEFMAKETQGLVALSAPIDELRTPLWILTHPDLRNTARVRAFMQLAGDVMQGLL
jgi:DNA-binding transcriptional LysR family regulator